ncbi:ulp1 protease family, C-terminal catalytic domain-containing protein [Tanacetum coccineum]
MNEPWLKSSLEYFTKVTTSNPVLRSATRGSSSRSFHTCVRTEIVVLEKNVKKQQMQIVDMQRRLLLLEDITKRINNRLSQVNHNVDNNVNHNVDHIVRDRVVLDKIFKEQQLQILDMKRRLLSLEHITKTQNNGLSEPDHNVDHLDKNGNGSVSVQVGGLDHQSTERVSHCMYSEHLNKNWNDVSENHPVDGLDHQSVEGDLADESESVAIDGLISLQSHDIHSQPFILPSKVTELINKLFTSPNDPGFSQANFVFGCVDVDNMEEDGCITDSISERYAFSMSFLYIMLMVSHMVSHGLKVVLKNVYFPVNEKDSHWCLAELHIHSGVITFYDSLRGLANGIEGRLFWLELRQIFEFHIPTYLDYADVFVKKNIDKTNYSISFQYAHRVLIQGGLYGDCGL